MSAIWPPGTALLRLNLAVVAYLPVVKRLFGLRGGADAPPGRPSLAPRRLHGESRRPYTPTRADAWRLAAVTRPRAPVSPG